ncbi:hypothetical protein J27TS7_16810 [Paenibacillus dendritiformis]|nr:hypothetical protein J27TS7_16810 [Paenibacillus dendritiformis]
MENPLIAAKCRRGTILDVPGDGALSGGAGRNRGAALPGRLQGQAALEPANNAALSGSVDNG